MLSMYANNMCFYCIIQIHMHMYMYMHVCLVVMYMYIVHVPSAALQQSASSWGLSGEHVGGNRGNSQTTCSCESALGT